MHPTVRSFNATAEQPLAAGTTHLPLVHEDICAVLAGLGGVGLVAAGDDPDVVGGLAVGLPRGGSRRARVSLCCGQGQLVGRRRAGLCRLRGGVYGIAA